jgi:hypothetical protein
MLKLTSLSSQAATKTRSKSKSFLDVFSFTMIWSPIYHMKHAWAATKTVWGKLALILFYSLIWVTIISAVWTIFAPATMGMPCLPDTLDKSSTTLFQAVVRGGNIFILGFMLYADVGGLQTKNVAMVTIFVVAYALTMGRGISVLSGQDCYHCVATMMWIWPSWAVAALMFTLVDAKLGVHGSDGERLPLAS